MCPEIELPDHIVILSLIFLGIPITFSTETTPFCSPTSNAQEFQRLNILIRPFILFYLGFFCFDNSHPDKCDHMHNLLAICRSFVKCLFKLFYPFYCIFICLLLNCRDSLYGLDITPLSTMFCKHFLPVLGLTIHFLNGVL